MTDAELLKLIEASRKLRDSLPKGDKRRRALGEYLHDLKYVLADRKASSRRMVRP